MLRLLLGTSWYESIQAAERCHRFAPVGPSDISEHLSGISWTDGTMSALRDGMSGSEAGKVSPCLQPTPDADVIISVAVLPLWCAGCAGQ